MDRHNPTQARLETARRRRARESGTTLVETLCAATILAVAIAGLASIAGACATLHRAGVEKDAAVRAAERQLTTIVSSDFATLQATYDGDDFAVGLEGQVNAALRSLPNDADGLPGSVQVTAPTGNAAELVEIVVRVDWAAVHGAATITRRMRLSRLGSGS